MKRIEIDIDGASGGNPGPSGIGVVIRCDDGMVMKISRFIGETTNNVAEYTALLEALREAGKIGAQDIAIKTDSELLYKQFKGEYKVRHANIVPLFARAKELIAGFKRVDITHTLRENNCEADKLAKEAVKKRRA